MVTFLWILHILVAIALIVVVLMQPGQAGGMGTAFGGGGSQSLFGSQGSTGFLGRLTAVLGTAFFLLSLTLAIVSTGGDESLLEQPEGEPEQKESEPAPPTDSAPPDEPEAPPVPGTTPGQGGGD
ncbi:MAG: preprotein translocase subunit SecG [Thiohalorhabdus sp.]|uniref:preprotein translocase subunit SecG n=1 Tax=Thiohalorhabdus sp. TaxID=3094134 RepID=UPI0039804EC8